MIFYEFHMNLLVGLAGYNNKVVTVFKKTLGKAIFLDINSLLKAT